MNSIARLERLRAGGHVRRFHTTPIIGEQNVAAHSWGVASIVLEIMRPDKPSIALIEAALNHDVAEFDTGDVPAHVKRRYPSIRTALTHAEYEIEKELDIMDGLTVEEELILKLADCIELCFFATEQLAMENRTMRIVLCRGLEYADKVLHDLKGKIPQQAFDILSHLNKKEFSP